MNCRSARNRLADLFDAGPIMAADAELEDHLRRCGDCREAQAAMEDTLAALRAPAQVRASAGFKERVMNQARTEATQPKTTFYGLFSGRGWKLAFAAGMLVVLVAVIPMLRSLSGNSDDGSAALTLLAQSAESISSVDSVYYKARMRTRPRDNFANIGLDYELVPVEMWKQFADPPRWRIAKPGRVAVMDGTTIVQLIGSNEAFRAGPRAGIAAWLRPLLDADQVLHRESALARTEQTVTSVSEEPRGNGRQIVLTVDRAAAGDFTNDWMRNKSIAEADHRRVFRFDAATKRLEGLEVYIRAGRGPVLVFEITEIRYNESLDPALFALELPPDVNWSYAPSEAPAPTYAAPKTPRETAVVFFDGFAQRDWQRVLDVNPRSELPRGMKDYWGGVEVLHIGEPFQSGLYSGWFVPYEIKATSGQIKKHNLAVRNDNPQERFFVDGGF